MSSNSDSQNIFGRPSAITDSDFNSNSSTSSSPLVSASSPVIDIDNERRTKNRHECSTFDRTNEEPALRASPLGAVVALGDALGAPHRTMMGLVERSPVLFPPSEASSSRPVGVATEGEAIAGPFQRLGKASSVNSDEVASVVRSFLSDEESGTLEADDDKDPPEIIIDDSDEEALEEPYMPPHEVGSAASVVLDMGWVGICIENRFLTKGPAYFAFPNDYRLMMRVEGDKITDCPPRHVADLCVTC